LIQTNGENEQLMPISNINKILFIYYFQYVKLEKYGLV